MLEFTAPSGAQVVINVADWADAKRLKKAIERELSESGLKIDLQADMSSLASALLRVDSSDAVDAALAPCLARCLRNGMKITDATFNDVEARKDYYEIVHKCIEENLRPLVESLLSLLKPFLASKPNQAEKLPV
jgi:hypothetical protein